MGHRVENFQVYGGQVHIGNRDYDDSSTDNRLPTSVCELPGFILSPYFTGRGGGLQQIGSMFSISFGDLPQRRVIYGMPGVGKTQLALKFAMLAFQNGQYPYVFWVSAASVEKLSEDVSKMVDLVRLPGRHMLNQANKLTAARAWLEDSTVARSWLVVLDNVSEDTVIIILRDFLPRENCNGRLLITTRVATIADRFTASERSSQLALQSPGIDDAVAMLSVGAQLEQEGREEANYTDIERLVQLVGNLPLAIDQAASFMRESKSSAQEVLDIYKSGEVSEILSWENDLSCYEEKSVAATFTPAINQIRGTAPDVLTLLRVLCFCDPENIPISIVTQGCSGLHREIRNNRPSVRPLDELEAVLDLFRSQMRLSKAIQEVQRLSLAACKLEGSELIIRIHDLVHLLLRSKLMTDTERGQWLKIAINVVCKAFEDIGDRRSPQNWSQCGRFISHIESLESFAKQYGIEDSNILNASIWAAIYLDACGLYEKAAALNEWILNQQKRVLGERHLSTLTSMNNLAQVLRNQGKYEEAEWIHRQTLALKESVLGKMHLSTLISMNNLATVLNNQGKYEEAEGIYRQTLALRESVLSKEHPNTLNSMNNLAAVLYNRGKYEEAEGICRQTLALLESVLGKKHPNTLGSMNNLAVVLKSQGKYEEAEGIYPQTLALRESILGKEHPDTLTSAYGFAYVLHKNKQYKDAELLYDRACAGYKKTLGDSHPTTTACLRHYSLMHEEENTNR